MANNGGDAVGNNVAVQATNGDAFGQQIKGGKAPHLYVELDFKEVTSKKAMLIEIHNKLREKVGARASISRECVLIYLDPESICSIVGWAAKTFPTAVFFLYEQIHPDDAFWEQMIFNLECRDWGFWAYMLHQPWRRKKGFSLIRDGRGL